MVHPMGFTSQLPYTIHNTHQRDYIICWYSHHQCCLHYQSHQGCRGRCIRHRFNHYTHNLSYKCWVSIQNRGLLQVLPLWLKVQHFVLAYSTSQDVILLPTSNQHPLEVQSTPLISTISTEVVLVACERQYPSSGSFPPFPRIPPARSIFLWTNYFL